MGSDVAFVGYGGLKTNAFGDARQECANIGVFQGDAGFDACVSSHTKTLEADLKKKDEYYCSALKTAIQRFENKDTSGAIEALDRVSHAVIEREKYNVSGDKALYQFAIRLKEILRGKEPASGLYGSPSATHPTKYETQDLMQHSESVIANLKTYMKGC